jgi:hypothetical protein
MSINSMTNVAVRKPKTSRELAFAATGQAQPDDPVTTALTLIVTYIPTEVIATYVAVMTVIHDPNRTALTPEWWVFWTFLIATPIVVWLIYAAKIRSAQPNDPLPLSFLMWPKWEMVAATIGYAVWAFALPSNPFTQGHVTLTQLSGVGVLVVSVALGLLAPIFKRRPA